MGKIIFYEEKNFGGRHYECMSDCADLHAMFDRCRSIRVEGGMLVIYDRPGYAGNQRFLRTGDYPDYLGTAGLNDCVRSCRMVPVHSGSFRLRLYEHLDMGGEMIELMDDCPDLANRFWTSGLKSCNVMDGPWLLYELPHYRGRHYYLRPGQYRSFSSRIGSIRRLMDL